MLESSQRTLDEASAEERGSAETFAASFMAAMLEQDLIPEDEARRVVAEHREGGTKDWQRTVYASLIGLRRLKG